jgi:hypothetical protein
VSALFVAARETLSVVAWIAASAAVDALVNALTTGQVKVDPLYVPLINIALFYAKEFLKAHREQKEG